VKILLVDNDPVYLGLMAEVLTMHGYTVFKAADGEAAFEQLQKEPTDIVISDVSMPKMNGMSLHRYIREDETLKSIAFAWNSGYRELREVLDIENPNLDFILDKAIPIPNLLYFLNHLEVESNRTREGVEA
jgi:DNA-binding response OmpR family regulator